MAACDAGMELGVCRKGPLRPAQKPVPTPAGPLSFPWQTPPGLGPLPSFSFTLTLCL